MMSATFAIVCDACEAAVLIKAQQDIKASIDVPDRMTVMGMDLCECCKLKAQMAVRNALGLHESTGKRVLN